MIEDISQKYACIYIQKSVIFPTEKVPLVLEGQEAIDTVNYAIANNKNIVIVFQKNGDISEIGVLCKIIQSWSLTASIMGIIVEGQKKIKVKKTFTENNITYARVEEFKKIAENETELEVLSKSVFDKFKNMIRLAGTVPLFLIEEMQKTDMTPANLCFLVAAALKLSFKEKIEILESSNVKSCLEYLNYRIAKELEILATEKRIKAEVEKEVNKTQKEYILRERMKAIEKELGIYEEFKEYDNLEKKIKAAKMPEPTERIALKELSRLRNMPAIGAETPYIRTYLELLAELPWNKKNESPLNLKKARKILDQDHYGLEKVKERVLEYLAVQKLTGGKSSSNIMCFVGPPGTGKTSVGKSIAQSLGRQFVRISLGGIHDEAEIRGHRRTYVGALPGRIIQSIKTAGTKNPVFMLDEMDKIGTDFRGDPSAALLEVLDPEQNNSFSDNYLEVAFDLSDVFFIATANIMDTVPHTLMDRMEIIEFTGYTETEKFNIAIKFLIPKVFASNGLNDKILEIDKEAIKKIISKYTREAGVRNLERKFSEIARKVAKKIAEKKVKNKISVTAKSLADYLGAEEYQITMSEEKDEIGISTGLAWTSVGGEIIFIEALVFPGKGDLILTGQLGETMQESAKAALSFIKSRSENLKIKKDIYEQSNLHIHIPSGAIPKDGPSAGIAIATAIASVLTQKKIKRNIALTGEITLSGKILEVGGIKEKILAAHRAGVKLIILPQSNKKNLADVPNEVKKELDFQFVSHMDEVLTKALKK